MEAEVAAVAAAAAAISFPQPPPPAAGARPGGPGRTKWEARATWGARTHTQVSSGLAAAAAAAAVMSIIGGEMSVSGPVELEAPTALIGSECSKCASGTRAPKNLGRRGRGRFRGRRNLKRRPSDGPTHPNSANCPGCANGTSGTRAPKHLGRPRLRLREGRERRPEPAAGSGEGMSGGDAWVGRARG